jgi:NAD(P)-dependent dehydrogenase (short-subunit alcohol dehydrogenase family)
MLKRPGTAEEVAACILFLVSNEALSRARYRSSTVD